MPEESFGRLREIFERSANVAIENGVQTAICMLKYRWLMRLKLQVRSVASDDTCVGTGAGNRERRAGAGCVGR